jgi:hypothetical protein
MELQREAASYQYHLSLDLHGPYPRVAHESLLLSSPATPENWQRLFHDEPPSDRSIPDAIGGTALGSRGVNWKHLVFDNAKPLLIQIQKQKGVAATVRHGASSVQSELAGMRFPDLAPEALRRSATAGQHVLGDRGENLPAVLQAIKADEHLWPVLLEWLRALTPQEFRDVEFDQDRSGRVSLVLVDRHGRKFGGESASDGTLRFLAVLAALFGHEHATVYVFEEIENGIHPSRAHLLVELPAQQSRSANRQIVVTTHAPVLLAALGEKDLENTWCLYARDDGHGTETKALRITEIPGITELMQSERTRLDLLFIEGWLDTATQFTVAAAPQR